MLWNLEIIHIKQEALTSAQRMMLLIINEIYIQLLFWDIYSKNIIEKNMADDLTVFLMTLNIRVTVVTIHKLWNGEEPS